MYFVFDIGGTKMRVAVSTNGIDLDVFRVIPTPENFEEALGAFSSLFVELTNGQSIEKIVGGIPGALTKTKDSLIRSPHLSDWVGKPLKQKIAEITGVHEIYLENDAAMVGLGEALVGAGRGFQITAYLTISTGIGGIRIIDGKIDRGMYGFEPGHHIIDIDQSILENKNIPEITGTKGEFENLASGSAIAKRFGMEPSFVTDPQIWEHIHFVLANGIANTILFWSPEVIVLGGGVVESGKIDIERIKFYLKQVLLIFPEHPEIRRATLKDLGGLHGALAYLRNL